MSEYPPCPVQVDPPEELAENRARRPLKSNVLGASEEIALPPVDSAQATRVSTTTAHTPNRARRLITIPPLSGYAAFPPPWVQCVPSGSMCHRCHLIVEAGHPLE